MQEAGQCCAGGGDGTGGLCPGSVRCRRDRVPASPVDTRRDSTTSTHRQTQRTRARRRGNTIKIIIIIIIIIIIEFV